MLDDETLKVLDKTIKYLMVRRSKNHFQIIKLLLDKGIDMDVMDTNGYLVLRTFFNLLDNNHIRYTVHDLGKRIPYPWFARMSLVKGDTSNELVYVYVDGQPYTMTRKEALEKELNN